MGGYWPFMVLYWNPWMFLFPEFYPSSQPPLKRDEPAEGK